MDIVKFGFRKYEVVSTISSTDQLLMLEVKDRKNRYVYKKYMTSAPFLDEFERYTKLYKCGIRIPRMIQKNKKTNECLFEVFEGDHCDKLLVENDFELPEIYYEQLFVLYRFCRFSKIELNYLPENFILRGKYLYYDSLDIYNQNTKINLESYGLYHWIKSKQAYKHLEALGYEFKNKQPLSSAEAKKKIVLISIKYW